MYIQLLYILPDLYACLQREIWDSNFRKVPLHMVALFVVFAYRTQGTHPPPTENCVSVMDDYTETEL